MPLSVLANFPHFRQTEFLKLVQLGLINAQDVVPAIHSRQIVVDVATFAKVGVKGAVLIQAHVGLIEDAVFAIDPAVSVIDYL